MKLDTKYGVSSRQPNCAVHKNLRKEITLQFVSWKSLKTHRLHMWPPDLATGAVPNCHFWSMILSSCGILELGPSLPIFLASAHEVSSFSQDAFLSSWGGPSQAWSNGNCHNWSELRFFFSSSSVDCNTDNKHPKRNFKYEKHHAYFQGLLAYLLPSFPSFSLSFFSLA